MAVSSNSKGVVDLGGDTTEMDVEDADVDSTTSGSKRSWVHEYFLINLRKKQYTCKICRTKSTGNLLGHMQSCHKEIYEAEIKAKQARMDTNEGVGFQPIGNRLASREEFLTCVVEFIVDTNQPFSIVERDSFWKLVNCASWNKEVTKPIGRTAITDRVELEFKKKKEAMVEMLNQLQSKISVVVDGWTSSNYLPFLGVVLRYVDNEGKLCTQPLDLIPLDGDHTGANIAHALFPVLQEFQILEKLLSVTSDNATNNDTMLEEFVELMKEIGLPFNMFDQHVRCLAHVLNLCAKDALSEFEKFEATKDLIKKLRSGVNGIRAHPKRREQFLKQCSIQGCPTKYPIPDVDNRWNSTYNMIKRVAEVKPGYSATLNVIKDISKHSLTDTDWTYLSELQDFMQRIERATVLMSKEKTPNIASSASVYQDLFKHFDSYLRGRGSRSDWRSFAAKAAKEKLEKYYFYTDGAAYVIGTVLHPSYKLHWHPKNGWPEEYVQRARDTITAVWKANYDQQTEVPEPILNIDTNSDDYLKYLYEGQMPSAVSSVGDELESYLASEPVSMDEVKSAGGLMAWWKMQHKYKNLYRMAMDYLAVAGSGVPVERWFSNGPDIVTSNRKSLSPEHVRMLMCLKCWRCSLE